MERYARTVEVTFEKSEILVVHRRIQKAFTAWCNACGANVRMVSPEVAAEISGISPRGMYRQIEAEQVHFVEPGEDELLVCIESLKKEPEENV